jgi:hypothetical protein
LDGVFIGRALEERIFDLNKSPKVHTPFSTSVLARLSLPYRLPILYIVSLFLIFLYHNLLIYFLYISSTSSHSRLAFLIFPPQPPLPPTDDNSAQLNLS